MSVCSQGLEKSTSKHCLLVTGPLDVRSGALWESAASNRPHWVLCRNNTKVPAGNPAQCAGCKRLIENVPRSNVLNAALHAVTSVGFLGMSVLTDPVVVLPMQRPATKCGT